MSKTKTSISVECAQHQQYLPLDQVTKPAVSTNAAAFYLERKPQTLRTWACFDNGPLRPIRVNSRLAWPVKEIKKILGIECQ